MKHIFFCKKRNFPSITCFFLLIHSPILVFVELKIRNFLVIIIHYFCLFIDASHLLRNVWRLIFVLMLKILKSILLDCNTINGYSINMILLHEAIIHVNTSYKIVVFSWLYHSLFTNSSYYILWQFFRIDWSSSFGFIFFCKWLNLEEQLKTT